MYQCQGSLCSSPLRCSQGCYDEEQLIVRQPQKEPQVYWGGGGGGGGGGGWRHILIKLAPLRSASPPILKLFFKSPPSLSLPSFDTPPSKHRNNTYDFSLCFPHELLMSFWMMFITP
jgi:hypothetical protein